MGESSLWSQAQGEGHKKQKKVMSRTFVNFSQVKQNCNHSLILLVLREFILTEIISFFSPDVFTGCGSNEWQCQILRICVSIIVLENLKLVLEKSLKSPWIWLGLACMNPGMETHLNSAGGPVQYSRSWSLSFLHLLSVLSSPLLLSKSRASWHIPQAIQRW